MSHPHYSMVQYDKGLPRLQTRRHPWLHAVVLNPDGQIFSLCDRPIGIAQRAL